MLANAAQSSGFERGFNRTCYVLIDVLQSGYKIFVILVQRASVDVLYSGVTLSGLLVYKLPFPAFSIIFR